jgi:uncharacterized protein YggE
MIVKRRLPGLALGFALLIGLGGGTFIFTARAGASGNAAPSKQSSAPSHMIAVAGHGEVSVPPDMATLQIGVQTKGDSASTALSENAQRMTSVQAAVQALGVPQNRIQTSDLSLWFDSEHGVYQASHQLTVRLDDISKVGPVLDAAVNAGANNSWGVSFGLKDPSAAQSAALRAAVTAARQHADSIASSLGVTIDGVTSASEANYTSVPPVGARAAAGAPAAPTPVQPGELTISADINVAYSFH